MSNIFYGHPLGLGYDYPNNVVQYNSPINSEVKERYYLSNCTDDDRALIEYIISPGICNQLHNYYIQLVSRVQQPNSYAINYNYSFHCGNDIQMMFIITLYRLEDDHQCFQLHYKYSWTNNDDKEFVLYK